MMRLVNDDKPDTPRARKAVAVNGQELWRREHDTGAARSQAGKHVIARCLHGLAGQHAHANAERSHRRREVISLVGNERAQRIDKDARTPAKDRLARGMHMEDKRLAAPRSHNGQNTLVIGQGVERLDLRAVRLVRSDKAMDKRARQLGIGKLGERLALAGLQTKTGVRRLHAAAKLTCRVVNAGRRGIADQDILDHELGLYATLPMLGHGLEHQIDGAIAIDELIDLRHAEHNGRHTRAPSVATKRMCSPVLPTTARSHIVTPSAARSGTLLPWPNGSRREICSMVSIFSSERSTMAATSSVSSKSSAGSSDSTAERRRRNSSSLDARWSRPPHRHARRDESAGRSSVLRRRTG